MKKIFLLIPLLFLTGCTINYELTIDKDEISENITGIVTKEESTTGEYETDISLYDYLTNYDQSVFYNQEDKFYNKVLEDNGDYYNYSTKYTYVGNNFKDSNIINSCFENHEINETDDFYDIHFSGNFYCQYANEIEINVVTKNAVINNNADKVKNNTYTWILKEGNSNVDISLTVSKNIEAFSSNKENSIFTPFRIITFIILLILVLVSFVIYKKRNSEN